MRDQPSYCPPLAGRMWRRDLIGPISPAGPGPQAPGGEETGRGQFQLGDSCTFPWKTCSNLKILFYKCTAVLEDRPIEGGEQSRGGALALPLGLHLLAIGWTCPAVWNILTIVHHTTPVL